MSKQQAKTIGDSFIIVTPMHLKDDLEEDTLTNEFLLEFAKKNRPPQSWYDESMIFKEKQ